MRCALVSHEGNAHCWSSLATNAARAALASKDLRLQDLKKESMMELVVACT